MVTLQVGGVILDHHLKILDFMIILGPFVAPLS